VANSRLYWTRSYAAAKHDGGITEEIARAALDMAEVDRDGLDKNDRKYLETLIDVFGGGPTGVEALAATMNLAGDTLSDEIEPYLLREQYIIRSPRGRIATPRGFTVLGKLPPRAEDKTAPGLFD
jgi:Holliday junction DNA helicase RuvB